MESWKKHEGEEDVNSYWITLRIDKKQETRNATSHCLDNSLGQRLQTCLRQTTRWR